MKWVKTILNSFIALALLIATTGMTLNKHYCLGEIKSISVNEVTSSCTSGEDGEPVQMPCCDDISQELKVEEITQVSFDFDSQPDLYQLAIITWALTDADLISNQNKTSFQYYSPPPPDVDFQSGYQVFII